MEIGAGVTMASIAASRDLAFLAPAARIDRRAGGPQHGDGRRQSLRPTALTATSPSRCWRSARRSCSRPAAAPQSIEDFLRDRGRDRTRIVAASSCRAARSVRLPLPQGHARQAEGRRRPVDRGRAAAVGRPRGLGRAHRLRQHGADAAARARRRAGAGGPAPRRAGHRARWRVALEGLSPPTDALASEWYRREVAPVHLKRLLLGAETAAHGQEAGPVHTQRFREGRPSSRKGRTCSTCCAAASAI